MLHYLQIDRGKEVGFLWKRKYMFAIIVPILLISACQFEREQHGNKLNQERPSSYVEPLEVEQVTEDPVYVSKAD